MEKREVPAGERYGEAAARLTVAQPVSGALQYEEKCGKILIGFRGSMNARCKGIDCAKACVMEKEGDNGK